MPTINNKFISTKCPLLLFSGGLDSTHCLLSLLNTTDVDVLIIKSKLIHHRKNKAEEKARSNILKILKRTYKNKQCEYKVRNIYTVNDNSETMLNHDGWLQPSIWLNTAINIVNPAIHSEVIIGYVGGDSILTKLHTLKKWWKAMYQIHRHNCSFIKLKFPIKLCSKESILKTFYDCNNEEILNHVWSCEEPVILSRKIVPCGKCTPCITDKAMKFKYNLLNKE